MLCLVLRPDQDVQTYSPLEIPELLFEFAKINSPESALTFANTYGLLTHRRHEVPLVNFYMSGLSEGSSCSRKDIFVERFYLEPFDRWKSCASSISGCLQLWEAIEAQDLHKLKRWVLWDGNELRIVADPAADALLPGAPQAYVHRWDQSGFAEQTFLTAITYADFRGRFGRGELIGPARLLLGESISRRLSTGTSLCVAGHTEHNALTAYHRPVSLESALWYQMLQLATGALKLRRCEICNDWMNITGRKSDKRIHDGCSSRERTRRYRIRLKARK